MPAKNNAMGNGYFLNMRILNDSADWIFLRHSEMVQTGQGLTALPFLYWTVPRGGHAATSYPDRLYPEKPWNRLGYYAESLRPESATTPLGE